MIAADSGVEHAQALGPRASTSSSATSTRRRPTALARGRRPRARRSSGTRPPRTPPTSSWPSTPPWRSAPRRIHVLGGHGGRLDHLLANAPAARRAPSYAARRRSPPRWAPARVAVVRDAATLRGPVGDLVTLLPVHGPARGVTTTGPALPARRRGPRPPAPPAASATSSSTTPPPSPSPTACWWPSSPASSAPTTRRPPDDHDPARSPSLLALGLALAACGDTTGPSTMRRRRRPAARRADDGRAAATPSGCSPTTPSC